MRNIWYLLLSVGCCLLISNSAAGQAIELSGRTMGPIPYRVVLSDIPETQVQHDLARAVDELFAEKYDIVHAPSARSLELPGVLAGARPISSIRR